MSKVLSGDEVGDCTRWEIPAVDDTAADALTGVKGNGGHLLTARQLEELQTQAYEEAYLIGRQEGIAAGREEIRARAAQLDTLMKALHEPFEELDESVERQVVELAIAIARQLIRRELKTDAKQIIGVVREALSILPVASRNVRLHLHPKDAELVKQVLSEVEGERAWKIMEDPVLTRGGCRITTDSSQIDARVESRLGAVVAAVLGNERQTTDQETSGPDGDETDSRA